MTAIDEASLQHALKMLSDGLTPHAISARLSVPLSLLLREFNRLIGEGLLRRTEILYSVPSERRTRIERELRDHLTVGEIVQGLKKKGLDDLWKSEEELADDYHVVKTYGSAPVLLGEMYDDIRAVEAGLFGYLEQKLIARFGDRPEEWWVQGIPVEARVGCAERHQRDSLRRPIHAYLDMIDLSGIVERNWSILEEDFKLLAAGESSVRASVQDFRRRLLNDLRELNEVRNIVMHPISRIVPTEHDFESSRRIRATIERLGNLIGKTRPAKSRVRSSQ